MDIQSEWRQQSIVLSLAGSLDALTADQVRDAIVKHLSESQQVILEMSGVLFMSSSGVRVLMEMLKTAREMGGDLRLACAQPVVQRTLEMAGLVRLVKAYASLEEAVDSFGSPKP